ncbi:MAG: nucleotidyltransferase domain-containing protein [Chloroflexota bacterium]
MSATSTLKPIEMDLDTWKTSLELELARFVELVINRFDPQRIILFGSLAQDNPKVWSDIDVIVIRETDARFIDRGLEIRSAFHPRVGMDILVYTPEEFEHLCVERIFFRQEILEKGKVLYEQRY